MTALRLSADWVVTMDGAPIRGGAVVVDGHGRITLLADPRHLRNGPGLYHAADSDAIDAQAD